MLKRAIIQDGQFQTREAEDDLYIDGYFAVFGAKYWLWDTAYETIGRSAFDLERDTDVRALVNHDTTLVLGRTTAGTLTLSVDDIGLRGTIKINRNDQDAVNLYERVKRGDVSQCSFGFEILEQEINEASGMPTEWRLKSVKLYEVSACTFPAYEDTEINARKAELDDINRRKIEVWRESMRNRLRGGKRC